MGPQDPGSDPLAPQTEKNLTGPSRIQSLGNTVFENLRRNPVFFPVSRGRIWSPWKASLILNARGKALIQGGGSNINLPPSTLAAEIFDLLDFYDIDFFSYARLIGLEKEKGQITCGIVSIKEGIRKIRAKLFIDATGDGDAAALADCPFMKGRASDGKVQSSTLIFIIGDIDIARMPAYMEIRKIWKSKKASSRYSRTATDFYAPTITRQATETPIFPRRRSKRADSEKATGSKPKRKRAARTAPEFATCFP